MHRIFLFALFAILARASLAEVTIRLVTSDDASQHRIIVDGLSQASLQALHRSPAEQLSRHFKLFVASSDLPPTTQSVLGECVLDRNQLVFLPRFGLVAGQAYRAEYHSPLRDQVHMKQTIRIPAATPREKSKVTAIYPSASELPRNLLRFYLHFSSPMQQGNVYQYILLTHENGTKLELPFLEISEELWDRTGTRLTLLLDPGRVKRGLASREEDGAILEPSTTYRLRVDSRWPDTQGVPLGEDTIKEFVVTSEDFTQPNPQEWRVHASKKSLELIFPDPLDHALLERCIEVVDDNNSIVLGKVLVTDQERRWVFSPASPWKKGGYTIRIEPILEDVAGNSIARPFEVDLTQTAGDTSQSQVLRFEIQ